MTQIKLDDICTSGAFLNAFVYHIAGMPWAATNSPELKNFLDNGQDTARFALRRKLFGSADGHTTNPGNSSAYDVQVLLCLNNDLGSQSFSFGEDKGLEVGNWSVKLTGTDQSGFTYTSISPDITCFGTIGLDCQPCLESAGRAYAIPSENIILNTSSPYTGTLTWTEAKDFGLSDYIIDNHVTGADTSSNAYLWIGSACLVATTKPVLASGEWTCTVRACQFGAPNEEIRKSIDQQHSIITNYPQGIAGLTNKLWGILFDNTVTIDDTAPTAAAWLLTEEPILLRHGKVKPNTSHDQNRVWTIQSGGFTDELKLKVTPDRFRGQLQGYHFSTQTLGAGSVTQSPHIMGVEYKVDTSDNSAASASITEFEFNISGAYKRYATHDLLLDDIVTGLNAAGLSSTYAKEGDDIVIIPGTEGAGEEWHCVLRGPATFAAGLGYLESLNFGDTGATARGEGSLYLTTINEVADKTLTPLWAGVDSIETVNLSNGAKPGDRQKDTQNYPINTHPNNWNSRITHASLRRQDDAGAVNLRFLYKQYTGTDSQSYLTFSLNMTAALRNPSKCAYFYQPFLDDIQSAPFTNYVWSNVTFKPAPKTGSGPDYYLYYNPESEVYLKAGDSISFGGGNASASAVVTAVGQINDINYFEVKCLGNGSGSADPVSYFNDTIRGMPYAMYYCPQIENLLNTNEDVREALASGLSVDVGQLDASDQFAITDTTTVESSNPVDIFKQLLGDPDIDVGCPPSIIVTTLNDITDRGPDHKGLIDWASLEELVGLAGLSDVDYMLDVKDPSTKQAEEATAPVQDFDLISMLQGLCLTHGIQMVWEYNPSIYAEWLTFKRYTPETIAEVTINGRIIDRHNMKQQPLSARQGGQWLYGSISANYKRKGGGNEVINYKRREGRTQHATPSNPLEIKDSLTRLPQDAGPAKATIFRRQSDYLKEYSVVHYKQNATTTLGAFCRLPVGAGVSLDYDPMIDVTTGKRDNGTVLADVYNKEVTLGAGDDNQMIAIGLTTNSRRRRGISPSLSCSSISRSGLVLTLSGLPTSAANNEWSPRTGLVDSAYFDCWNYNKASNTTEARSCSCGDYNVTIFPLGVQSLFKSGVNQNVWDGTIEVTAANIAAGTATITIADSTYWDAVYAANADWVVIFGAYDVAGGLQTCQKDLYGWLGDSSGNVTDAAGATVPAITIGS